MQIIFILTGLIFLFATIAQLVMDMVNMFQTTAFKFQTLYASLLDYIPAAAASIKQYVDVNLAQSQWAEYINWVLAKPTFAVLGVIGILFVFLSFLFRKRKHRTERDDFI